MTTEKIIETIKDNKERYLKEASFARVKLQANMKDMTAQQISTEMMFIQDMESRAYCLFLLLEELEAL